jgi:glycosyltransferase involved in cell wall biosynthesis
MAPPAPGVQLASAPTLAVVVTPPGDEEFLDISDLVEFYAREESPSGVQRVIENVAPFFLDRGVIALSFDRARGLLVPIPAAESSCLVDPKTPRHTRGALARAIIDKCSRRPPLVAGAGTVVLFPGAVWINDALMLAAWNLARQGVKLAYLLYDITPVIEAGHTAAVNQLFERYLWLLAQTGSRVSAISDSSRRDFVNWCFQQGIAAPEGVATGLPNGLDPSTTGETSSPWPRPYALMVGTIESRKNHMVAFDTWRQLIERHRKETIPDLVCIGRLGWNANEFLEAYVSTRGLDGKVSVLTASVPDDMLARFYRHAMFTIYPSRYEGWGLPVSESIAFGTPVICADNSSLREAGGAVTIYVPTNDSNALLSAIEENMLKDDVRKGLVDRILENPPTQPTWREVADMLIADLRHARRAEVPLVTPAIEVGREYCLAPPPSAPDGAHADAFLAHVTGEGATPMLRSPREPRDFEITDAAVTGVFGAPQTWGLEVRPGLPVTLRFLRPTDQPLTVLIATRSMPGRVVIEAAGPGGPHHEEVYLGSVIRLPLGAGVAGSPAQTTFSVVDASDSIEGFLGIRSFLVLVEGDLRAQVLAMEAAMRALRQELDFITGTRSWRLTAPLRRWKGRGA